MRDGYFMLTVTGIYRHLNRFWYVISKSVKDERGEIVRKPRCGEVMKRHTALHLTAFRGSIRKLRDYDNAFIQNIFLFNVKMISETVTV